MKKNWYASKTVWAAILTAILGVCQALQVGIPAWVLTVLMGAGLYGVRDAINT